MVSEEEASDATEQLRFRFKASALYRANDLLSAYENRDLEAMAAILDSGRIEADETIVALLMVARQVMAAFGQGCGASTDDVRARVVSYLMTVGSDPDDLLGALG